MSICIVVVGGGLLVVHQTQVVSKLVAKAEIAKSAALLADGDGPPRADGVEVRHSAAVEVH